MRSLRIEVHLVTLHHLQQLVQANFVCAEDESRDVEDCIPALSRCLIRSGPGCC